MWVESGVSWVLAEVPTFFVWCYLRLSYRRASEESPLRGCGWDCSLRFASAGLIIQWFRRQRGILGAQTCNNTRTPGLWRHPLFLPNNVFTLMSVMLGRPREVFSICALAPDSPSLCIFSARSFSLSCRETIKLQKCVVCGFSQIKKRVNIL